MRITFYIFTIIFLFTGCEHNSNTKNNQTNKNKTIKNIETNISKHKNNTLIIKEKDFNLTFVNSKLVYPKNKLILLFDNNSLYSKEEEKILKRLNIKFHKTENKFLANYFKIIYYPSIIILDKNQTVIYQNFMPYEMLKTQGF